MVARMSRRWWLGYVLIGGFSAFFAYDALDAMFNPHVVGYVTSHGRRIRFDDNGDRFLYSVMELGIPVIGVAGLVGLARSDRKEAGDRRWHWQVGVGGELLARTSSNVEMIEQDVNAFDGKLDFCSLVDQDTGSYLVCYGEPERRVVEACLSSGPSLGRFVVARQGCTETSVVQVRRTHQTVDVAACEVLSGWQSLEILLAFRAGHPIPAPYALLPKSYLPAQSG
jgi:hypothetical protein